uniref:Uncharacterized protein n=1 Tax=Chenopodium quinoa TaxID=63459 RepID=A0A803M3P8_CHEQI
MNLTPLHIAIFATEDEIEQGMTTVFLDAFESDSFWPCSLYNSGKGRDIMSPKIWQALGLVVRSMASGSSFVVSGEGEVEGFVSEGETPRMVVLGLGFHHETTPKPTSVDELGFQRRQLGANEELGFCSESGSSLPVLNKPRSVAKPPPGLGLFTMTQFLPSLKPCSTTPNSCDHASKVHKVVFFVAAYLVALATGGYKPCLESFEADQFDDNHSKERKQKMSFFNWWNIALCSGLFIGVTLIVYLQEYVSWGIGYLTLTITMGVTVLVFVLGRPYYRYRHGSPLTPLFHVLVAAIAKRNLNCPSDSSLLNEVHNSEKPQGRVLGHTNRLRFLDKAAIIEEHEHNGASTREKQSPWRLATVTQVEELKLIITMVPIWLTSLMFGIGIAQLSTFFIKQGSEMNRKVFKHFEIPAASVYALTAVAMFASVAFYDKVLFPYLRGEPQAMREASTSLQE